MKNLISLLLIAILISCGKDPLNKVSRIEIIEKNIPASGGVREKHERHFNKKGMLLAHNIWLLGNLMEEYTYEYFPNGSGVMNFTWRNGSDKDSIYWTPSSREEYKKNEKGIYYLDRAEYYNPNNKQLNAKYSHFSRRLDSIIYNENKRLTKTYKLNYNKAYIYKGINEETILNAFIYKGIKEEAILNRFNNPIKTYEIQNRDTISLLYVNYTGEKIFDWETKTTYKADKTVWFVEEKKVDIKD